MSMRLAAVRTLEARQLHGPVHRSIVAVDVEGSTRRTNPVKGELRRILYELLDRALTEAGIAAKHLEELTDRGDGVLLLVRPHDDVPKTVLLGRLIPALTALLVEYNAAVTQPDLQVRLRAVVHAGEIHYDGKGFYGDDLDVAFRLLDSPGVKRALKEAAASPLVLVISEEIFNGIVQQGYLSGGPYLPLVRVRVGRRLRRGWVHVPTPAPADRTAGTRRLKDQPSPTSLAIAPAHDDGHDRQENHQAGSGLSGRGGPRPEPG